MKKRTLTLAIIAALVFSLGGAGSAFADASDTATLNLTGNVPSLVRIGFEGYDDGADVPLGDLTESVSETITIRYLANVDFTVSVQSTEGGQLVHSDSGEFRDFKAYTIIAPDETWDEMTADTKYTIFSSGRGSSTFDITITTDPVNLDEFDFDSSEGDIWAEGDYEDTLTFTIEADG